MRYLLIAVSVALSGCTMIVGDAQRVLYEDAIRYVEENHESRRTYRAAKERLVLGMIGHYERCVFTAQEDSDSIAARECFEAAMVLLEAHYRDLATVEALRAGIDDFGEFKSQVEMMEE